MIGKDQQLYKNVLERICYLLPQFNPKTAMFDWEIAPRNAMKEAYPDVKIRGCWFHLTPNVWHHIQKLGLVQTFNTNHDFSAYVRKLMAIPFLRSN